MFIKSDFAFVHIPKTAGKAMEKYFHSLPRNHDDRNYKKLEHIPLSEKLDQIQNKKVFCNIRNPWDWYVSRYFHSLYSFNPRKIPTVRNALKTIGYDIELYRNYSTHEINEFFMKKEIFTDYLEFIYNDNFSLLEQKEFCLPNVGALTFEYFRLCSTVDISRNTKIKDVFENHDKLIGVDMVFKMEELPHNVFNYIRNINPKYDNVKFSNIRTEHKLSSHRNKNYREYYNDKTRKLIQEKETFIIKKFDYKFD